MSKSTPMIVGGACFAGLVLASGALAQSIPFETGRFLSDGREVFHGAFSGELLIDSITLGDATFRVDRNELLRAASVRVYVDPEADGSWMLLSDDDLAGGMAPVGFGLGRDIDPTSVRTALDAMDSLNLNQLLYTDGSATVRIDVLLTSGLYDDAPDDNDNLPEALLFGNLGDREIRLSAIIGGSIDDPVLSIQSGNVTMAERAAGETGIAVISSRRTTALPISVVGFDLSATMGVDAGTAALGYRLEIEAGSEAYFSLLGCGFESQILAQGESVIALEDLPAIGEFGGGGGGAGAGTVGRLYSIPTRFFASQTAPFRPSGSRRGFDQPDFIFPLEEEVIPEAVPDEAPPDNEDKDPADRIPPDGPDIGGDTSDIRPFIHGDFVDVNGVDVIDGPIGTPIPGPGALSILGLAGLIGRRRRNG